MLQAFNDLNAHGSPTSWGYWMLAIVPLVGVVVGAVLNSWTNRNTIRLQALHAEEAELRKVRREKMEEVYLLLEKWANAFTGDYLHLSLVMRGEGDYNAYLDKVIEGSKNFPDFTRLQMLIDVYCPTLRADLDSILSIRDRISAMRHEHKAAYKRAEDGTRFLKPMGELQLALSDACADLCVKVAAHANGSTKSTG